MRILLESRAFYPSVGGLEMMSRNLAEEWQSAGHQVRIVTLTPLDGEDELDGPMVKRLPSPGKKWNDFRWADVFVQSGISLRSQWGPVLTNTPLVMIHHNLLEGRQSPPVRTWLKRRATHLGANVAVSNAVEETIPGPTVHIPNTFRPLFDQVVTSDQDRDGLLFVGRLVSVKGADVAVEALLELRHRELEATLTICGDGPEKEALEAKVRRYGLGDAVTFAGWVSPEELVAKYRRAEALLVPSRYEPFGIVALEAIACGCPVVASDADGLPEAVGDCGVIVPAEDPEALAAGVERVLRPEVREELREAMPPHVDRHRVGRIAGDYLHLLRRVVHSDR